MNGVVRDLNSVAIEPAAIRTRAQPWGNKQAEFIQNTSELVATAWYIYWVDVSDSGYKPELCRDPKGYISRGLYSLLDKSIDYPDAIGLYTQDVMEDLRVAVARKARHIHVYHYFATNCNWLGQRASHENKYTIRDSSDCNSKAGIKIPECLKSPLEVLENSATIYQLARVHWLTMPCRLNNETNI